MTDETEGRNLAETYTPRASGWAIGALVCSLIVFCLPISMAGALLGLKALADIRRRPGLAGRNAAIAAIIIGSLTTLVWAAGGAWWHVNVRRPIMRGPVEAIWAGQSGDVAAFQTSFTPRTPAITTDESRRFLADLTGRYGRLRGMRQVDDDRPPPARYQFGGYRIPYQMEFETGPIMAEAEFVISTPADGLVARFAWVAIRDPDRGDLVFPAAATEEARARTDGRTNDDGR